jgi:hypothetical protein
MPAASPISFLLPSESTPALMMKRGDSYWKELRVPFQHDRDSVQPFSFPSKSAHRTLAERWVMTVYWDATNDVSFDTNGNSNTPESCRRIALWASTLLSQASCTLRVVIQAVNAIPAIRGSPWKSVSHAQVLAHWRGCGCSSTGVFEGRTG